MTKLRLKITSDAVPVWRSFALVIALSHLAGYASLATAERLETGLVVLYDFADTKGDIVKDRSGFGKPLNLKIEQVRNIVRQPHSIKIVRPTSIISDGPATKVIDAVQDSREMSIEAWLRPANLKQKGPARIVSLSNNPVQRNFTLGQEADKFDVRLRVTKTNDNGLPSLASPSKSVNRRLTHVVYTRRRTGQTRIYVDGKIVANGKAAGAMEKWDKKHRLVLGNEVTGDRPWKGALYLVAIYKTALYEEEVVANYKAGPGKGVNSNDRGFERLAQSASATRDPKAIHFETKIAPLLSAHCLECHDSPSHKGGLDLSRKSLAFKGGDTGPAIVPGKLDDSVLWDSVESESMPLDRPPLTKEQKRLLRDWIADGATWSLDMIDPAVYVHGDQSREWVRRLTVDEYIATVRDTVDVDVAAEARKILPRDLRADGFSNTAYNLNVDLNHVLAYDKLARIIVSRMDCDMFARQFSKSRKFTDDSMGKLIEGMGKHVLRGPIKKREIIAYRGITTSVAASGGEFSDAVALVLRAMLQSPRFIYRVESQRGDGAARSVDDYELANRISYIVWGSAPDSALLSAAEDGDLGPDSVRENLKRMFNDPRAKERSLQFASDWLNLNRLANLQPNPEKFPDWNAELAADMREETLAFFEEVVWKRRLGMSALMNAQVTFATPALARHYGLEVKENSSDRSFEKAERYDLSRVAERGGLLTQGSILTIGGDEASMVTRGLFVMHDLLRGVVRDPPPCVDTTPVPSEPGVSQRLISEQRIANESCGGCHSRFEPLAFGLEKFDGVGAYHEKDEHGNSLRDDGTMLVPGLSDSQKYKSSAELMRLLAESDRVKESITWKVVQFAVGRPLGARDAAVVSKIHKNSQKNGGKYTDILTEVIFSELVQFTRTEK